MRMRKQVVAFINSTLCKMEIYSILLLVPASTISGQMQKPSGRGDSLTIRKKDIIDVLHNKFKTHLRKDSTMQNSKRVRISIMPIDHQYLVSCNTNINFDKLKMHLSGATRCYNFPTNIYSMGNNTSLADVRSIQFSYLRAYQIVFRKLVPHLFAGIGYNLDYHWNIKANLAPGEVSTDFDKLQKGSSSVSSAVSFNVQFDNRDNATNPQNGTYINLQYRPNLSLFGSTRNWHSLLIDVRHYIPVFSRNVLALWGYSNITLAGTPPYLDLPSIGWDDCSNTGRGYSPGRYTGRNLVYFESEYRFPLTSNGLLGGVVFGNAGSLLKNVSSELHTIIPGAGAGLRIKMNKYSNTNVALDFGFGVAGSWSFSFNFSETF